MRVEGLGFRVEGLVAHRVLLVEAAAVQAEGVPGYPTRANHLHTVGYTGVGNIFLKWEISGFLGLHSRSHHPPPYSGMYKGMWSERVRDYRLLLVEAAVVQAEGVSD